MCGPQGDGVCGERDGGQLQGGQWGAPAGAGPPHRPLDRVGARQLRALLLRPLSARGKYGAISRRRDLACLNVIKLAVTAVPCYTIMPVTPGQCMFM